MKIQNVVISCCIFTVFSSVIIPTAQAEVVSARFAGFVERDDKTYEPGSMVPISVKISALGKHKDTLFLVSHIENSNKFSWTNPVEKISIWRSNELTGAYLQITIPDNAPSGWYDINFELRKGFQTSTGQYILQKQFASTNIMNAFEVIHISNNPSIFLNDDLIIYDNNVETSLLVIEKILESKVSTTQETNEKNEIIVDYTMNYYVLFAIICMTLVIVFLNKKIISLEIE